MIINHQIIKLQDKIIFQRAVFKPPLKVTQMMNDEACLIYCQNGESKLYGQDQQFTLSNDESILMKCGNFVNHWQITESANPFEAITIHFFPDILKLIFDNHIPDFLKNQNNPRQLLLQKIDSNTIIKSFMQSLSMYFENPTICTQDTIKLKLKEFITLLYNMNSGGIRAILSDLFNPQQVAFKEVITSHLFQDLSLEELAALLNVSLSTFKRRFAQIYDCPPRQYILQKKLDKAALLLSTSKESVSNICYDCGFGDLSNFTKAFTKKYHYSPSAYRKLSV